MVSSTSLYSARRRSRIGTRTQALHLLDGGLAENRCAASAVVELDYRPLTNPRGGPPRRWRCSADHNNHVKTIVVIT